MSVLLLDIKEIHLTSLGIKLKSKLKKKKSTFLRFTKLIMQIDWGRLNIEIRRLQEDLKKYKSGILLWAKEEYPNYMLIISALYGNIFEEIISTFRVNMKKVVDEYFKFLDDVKAENLELYQKEIEESNELVFKNQIQPKDILATKDAYIKHFNRKFSESLETYSAAVHNYTEKLTPVLFSFAGQIKEFLVQNRYNDSKKDLKFDIEKASSVSNALQQLKKLPKNLQKLRRISKDINKRRKKIQKKSLSNISELDEKFKNLTEQFFEIYGADETLWVYLRLLQIKEVDSFHIHFTKFVARLFHILSKNNNNYAIYIEKEHHRDTRRMLKSILEHKINKKYPKLSNYLRSMFNYNKYRRIEAHHAPRVRFSNEIAYISIPGTEKEVAMNLKEINGIIKTYSYFIEALGLPKP